MRTPIIAGNWKMHKTVAEAFTLVEEMREELAQIRGVEKVLCPPFTALYYVSGLLQGTDIGLGGQNMYWEEKGAYTGEISPLMLQELCRYVIIGHSERRKYFGETDETVNCKVRTAFEHGLTPILCVGENLEQNEGGLTEKWVSGQVEAALDGLTGNQVKTLIIAYEPIWAIGTGKPATGPDANAIIGKVVRHTVASLLGDEVAQAMRIQYGGSVKADDIVEFMSQPEIDGALVGGASIVAEQFIAITRLAAETKANRT